VFLLRVNLYRASERKHSQSQSYRTYRRDVQSTRSHLARVLPTSSVTDFQFIDTRIYKRKLLRAAPVKESRHSCLSREHEESEYLALPSKGSELRKREIGRKWKRRRQRQRRRRRRRAGQSGIRDECLGRLQASQQLRFAGNHPLRALFSPLSRVHIRSFATFE